MSDREYVSATNTLSASTAESRAPDQIPSSRHADNLHRLSRGLLLGVLLTALAVGVIYAREQPWQALASLGVLLVSLGCLGLGRAAIEQGELEKAGYWLLANALIAYGSAELLWQGPTLQNLISGILIMLVIGTIAFPHRWYIWIGTALIHLLWTWLINVSPPFPRYPLDTAWESHLVFVLTMLVIIDIVGRVFRLGGQISTLEERVDNLRQADATLRRQLTELSVLHAVAVAGTEAADEDALLERATQIIGETLYPDNFGILLLEPDRKHLRPHPSYRFSGEMERMGVVPLGKGITGTVAAEGKSICVTNAQQNHHYVEFDLRTRSELCVPIQIGGEILGVINTESSQVNAFSTADEQLLTTFAGQLATAIDRLRRTRESQRKAQQMATIYNLGHQITSILSLDDLLPAIVRLIVDSLDLYNAEIALLEDNILKFRAGYGGYTNPQHSVRARYSLKTTQGITGKAALTGTSLLVPDVRESEDYIDYPPLPHVRAELAVPLKAKGEIIGVLDVKSDEPYGLTENDAATLEILAAQVAVAVQNARLFEAQQEQRRELTGLYETALATTSQLEPDLMLRRLYDQIQQLLNPDFFAAALYDAELDEVSIVLAIEGGKSVPDFVDLRIPLKKSGLSGWVMRSRESLYLADMEQDTLPLTPRYVGKTRTWFGVPLIAHDRLIGAISVQSAHPNAFSMTQRRFLESVANQVAVALENARLYRSALEANQRMAILHRTSQEFVTASVDPEQVYVAIHEAASQLMASEAFVISLLNKTEESINLVYIVDRSGRHAPEQIPSDRGISGQVISTGKPLLVPEIDENDSLDPVHFGDPDPVHSILAVPLKLGGKVFGMLSAQSYEPRAHTIEDQRLLEMLASHAAAALENTRLLRAERERKAELEAIRQASLQVTSSLELEPVLQAILEHSLKIIDADNAHIFLYNGEKLSFGAGLWSEGGRTGIFAEPRSDGLTYRVARTGKRVVVHNMKSHPLFVDTPWDGAIVGLPLKLGEKITGVMNVAFHQPHYFDENELRTLALLGDQAAIAIRNAELFEAAQRQLEELRLLHNVATACAEATDEDIIIERATELIGRSLYPDNFGIMLVDDSSAQLHFHASYRGLPERHRTCKLHLGEGIAGQVAESGRPHRIPDVSREPTYLALAEDMRSEVCVPMVVGDRVIGILNAESHQPEAFSENDERLLMTISGQLATAIEKARLFAEIAEALEREQRYNEVARTISSALDLPAILENVVRQAVQLVGADAGVMLLPSVSEDSLVPSYLYNLPASMEMRFVRPEEGLAWEVMESGRSVLVQEYGSNPSARPELLELNVHSVMEAPVKVGGKSIGVLCVFGMESRTHFTARDLSLVESVALQAGVAIQNARLFTETEQHAEELAAALARLEELDNLKSEFIQNVSHELRTPLAIIRGYVELLEMGELGELRPEQKGPIDIVARRARMLTKMVEELTTILEAESKKSHYEIVSLVPFIEGLLEDFQASAQEAGLTLLAEIETEEAVVLGDPVHLRRVLDNLLSNAFKFTPEGGAIAVGLRTANNHAILEVADTGIGIPEDKLERIFERFYQVDGSMTRRYGGTGLGLALVKEIVENHGGTIEVESAVGEGTVFHITLPLHQGSIPEEI